MIEQLKGGRIVRLELKYCERCGGLLLRESGDSAVYCGSCARALSEMPVPERRERKGSLHARPGRHAADKGKTCSNPTPVVCESSTEPTVPRKPPQSVRIEASERRLG